MEQQNETTSQVVFAPTRTVFKHPKKVFLAGSTAPTGDEPWRETLKAALSQYPVTIFDPYRSDWDKTWIEDINFPPFREQVNWELDMQEAADVIVVYFHPNTKAPISLLELGLCASQHKGLVVCPPGYWKRGNVQAVCQRHGIDMMDSDDDLAKALLRKLGLVEL